MRKSKKLLSVILSLVMLISVFCGFQITISASNFDSAMSVSLNRKVTNITNSTCYYSFSAPHSGYYKISLKMVRCTTPNNSVQAEVGTVKKITYRDDYYDDDYGYYSRPSYYTYYRWNDDSQTMYAKKDDGVVSKYFEATTDEKVYIKLNTRAKDEIEYEFIIEESQDYFREIYSDGLYYKLDVDMRTATVIGPSSERYIYRIPSKVEYNKMSFTVNAIADYAFNYCNDLTELYLPETIKEIGDGAFTNSAKLRVVDIKNNGYLKYQNGVLFNSRMDQLIWYPSYLTNETYNIPDSVNIIRYGAFQGATNLKEIKFTNNLFVIEDNAFNNTGLRSVSIPNSVESIGESVFANNEFLKSVSIGDGVREIGNKAFYNCSIIRSITIPNSVKYISDYAFASCSKLINVCVSGIDTEFGYKVFNNCPESLVIYASQNSNAKIYADEENIYCLSSSVNCEHNYQLIKSTNASCDSQGCNVYECVYCKDLVVDYTSKIEHSFTETVLNPTCTTLGVRLYTCAICGYSYAELVDIIEHKVVMDKSIKATCIRDGLTEGSHCETCGKIIDEQNVIPAIDHNYRRTVVNPTCETKGYTINKCTICGDTYKDDYTNITKHSYNSIVTRQPSCDKEGVRKHTCVVCGDTYNTEIDMLEHTIVNDKAVASTYTKTGLTAGSHCSVCNNVIVAQKTVAKKTLAKPTSFKATAVSKGFKLTWKKVSVAKGYEIQYSTSSSFSSPKKLTISSNSTVSKSVTKLAGNKKYYVRIRSYYKDSNGTAYSSWVSTYVTTKK